MSPIKTMEKLEAEGIAFRLEGEKVLVWFPDPQMRNALAEQIAFLRAHKIDVAQFLLIRTKFTHMPTGICLRHCHLKQPPVAIETGATVTNPALFATATLDQLKTALLFPRRWVGWHVPQLIHRLAQVGVIVARKDDNQ
jgi:hypothetical protein